MVQNPPTPDRDNTLQPLLPGDLARAIEEQADQSAARNRFSDYRSRRAAMCKTMTLPMTGSSWSEVIITRDVQLD